MSQPLGFPPDSQRQRYTNSTSFSPSGVAFSGPNAVRAAESIPKNMSTNSSYTTGLKTPSPEQPAYHKRQDSVQTSAFNPNHTQQGAYGYPMFPQGVYMNNVSSTVDQHGITSATSPEHASFYKKPDEGMQNPAFHSRQISQGQWNQFAIPNGAYTPMSEPSAKSNKRRHSPEAAEQPAYNKRPRQDSAASNAVHSRQVSQQAQYTAYPMATGLVASAGDQHVMSAQRMQMPFTGQYVPETPVTSYVPQTPVTASDSIPRYYSGYGQHQGMPNGLPQYTSPAMSMPSYGYVQNISAVPAATGPGATGAMIQSSPIKTEQGSKGPEERGPVLDTTGQTAPPNHKIKASATLWEDERTLCAQIEVDGITVARREDNNMINGTKLLNISGMTRGRRDGILKAEKDRRVIKIGPMHLKGVWIPIERALQFANKERITDKLYPLFSQQIWTSLYPDYGHSRVPGTHTHAAPPAQAHV